MSQADLIEAETQQIAELVVQIRSQRLHHARLKADLRDAEKQVDLARSAQEIIQFVAQAVQQKAHERIAKVVSSCLSSVFSDPYEFRIEFERKRGRTEAALRFVRRGLDVDPMESSGGGMIDVAAFALRVACLIMHRPRLRQILVLDEPFKFVSAEYRENVRSMLEKLSTDLGLQIIMVTHIDEIATGKIVRLKI